MKARWLPALAGVVFFSVRGADAATIDANPASYLDRVAAARCGDTVRLAAGTYTRDLDLHGIHCSAGNRLVITGPESGAAAVFLSRRGAFDPASRRGSVHIWDISYVTFQHLDFDGAQLPGHAFLAKGPGRYGTGVAHHITLAYLRIREHGVDQQTVGISTKIPAWNWHVHHVYIDRPGTGMYFGESDGTAPFFRSVVEDNLIVDPIGYNMQIKHQVERVPVPGMPLDPSTTIVRNNVFVKAGQNSSTGGSARPNFLVGNWPPSGPGASDTYEIHGNFLYQNASAQEALFQGDGNYSFHDNVLVNTIRPGRALFVFGRDAPKDVKIYHNTIYGVGDPTIWFEFADPTRAQFIVANAIFADLDDAWGGEFDPALNAAGDPIFVNGTELVENGGSLTLENNVVARLAEAPSYLRAPSDVLGSMDFTPVGSGLICEPTPFSGPYDGQDFRDAPRDGEYCGAYACEGTGCDPHWALNAFFKGGTSLAFPPPPACLVHHDLCELDGDCCSGRCAGGTNNGFKECR